MEKSVISSKRDFKMNLKGQSLFTIFKQNCPFMLFLLIQNLITGPSCSVLRMSCPAFFDQAGKSLSVPLSVACNSARFDCFQYHRCLFLILRLALDKLIQSHLKLHLLPYHSLFLLSFHRDHLL